VTLVADDQSAHDASDYRMLKRDIVSVTFLWNSREAKSIT
jgi:hypothetical protein